MLLKTRHNYHFYHNYHIIIIVTELQFNLLKTHLMSVPNACALSYTLANSAGFNSSCCLAAIFHSGRTTEVYLQKRVTKENHNFAFVLP